MATLIQDGQVKSNTVGLAYARQTALGVLPTSGWQQVEPNAINTSGATITTVARTPISINRQRRKGTVTDLDSALEYDADLTLSSFRDHAEGFMFAQGVNTDVTQLGATGATASGSTYTGLTALTAEQADKFEVGSLIWVTGGALSANAGLKSLDADATTSDTVLSVNETLSDETAALKVSFAGYRIPSTDSPTWTWDGAEQQATLAGVVGIGTTLFALGMTRGQFVHIGSIAELAGSIQNGFENSAANDMFGYARVLDMTADSVVFDKVGDALQFTDSSAPATAVDVVFGEFLRNVPVNDPDFCEIAYTYETSFPGLGDGTPGNTDTSFQYSIDNFVNTLGFNLPLTDKATVSYALIGTDTQNPTTTQQAGADSAVTPTQVVAFNTSADIARLRITDVDEGGLTTDFKSLTMNINNNASPEKVLGRLGARFINIGNLEIDIETQLLFTNPLVVAAIRDNQTLSMDFIIKNDDGVIAVDIPSMTLGDGSREFPVNESVLINTTAQAFGDPQFGTSIGISLFPVPFA